MSLYKALANCHPKIARNQVWCRSCGASKKIFPEECFQHGWPKCCGCTMTIDSPEEQEEFKNGTN